MSAKIKKENRLLFGLFVAALCGQHRAVDTFPDATVLVVDDTPEDPAAVGCFLEGLCSTAAALSGEEALELALKLQPHVILLDVLMPGMSGLDVLKELQSHPVTKSIAVLLVTSLSDPESKLEGFACGAATLSPSHSSLASFAPVSPHNSEFATSNMS